MIPMFVSVDIDPSDDRCGTCSKRLRMEAEDGKEVMACALFGPLYADDGTAATAKDKPTYRLLACREHGNFALSVLNALPNEAVRQFAEAAFGPVCIANTSWPKAGGGV